MKREAPVGSRATALRQRNRAFYDALWRGAQVRPPQWFATWDVVQELLAAGPRALEIGPGARPRLPLPAAIHLDVSRVGLRRLASHGARAVLGDALALPLRSGCLDAVAALDVIEHVEEPERVLVEIGRVLRPGGLLLLAVPVHSDRWTPFDDTVGHGVRFEPARLSALLASHGFEPHKSATFGLLPGGWLFPRIAAWCLRATPRFAAWFEDRIVLPVARRREPPLCWQAGLVVARNADGILVLASKLC